MMANNPYFLISVINITLKDKYGTQNFRLPYLEDSVLKSISSSNIEKINKEHESFLKDIHEKCTKLDESSAISN